MAVGRERAAVSGYPCEMAIISSGQGWEPSVNVREGLARTIEYFSRYVGTPMMARRAPRARPASTPTG